MTKARNDADDELEKASRSADQIPVNPSAGFSGGVGGICLSGFFLIILVAVVMHCAGYSP